MEGRGSCREAERRRRERGREREREEGGGGSRFRKKVYVLGRHPEGCRILLVYFWGFYVPTSVVPL